MKPQLSFELVVACEIYRANLANEPIWYSKLVEILKEKGDKKDVSNALDLLSDWGIIKGHYDKTEKGRAGYVYEITDGALHVIRGIHYEVPL